jgi:hypothetical protein
LFEWSRAEKKLNRLRLATRRITERGTHPAKIAWRKLSNQALPAYSWNTCQSAFFVSPSPQTLPFSSPAETLAGGETLAT